ncbi:DUF5309 family protein [Ramlibacter sp. AN1015]|uniref:SU10 major capsid protein n=1 Tax=Ramlibacter sp. AN1015 TaxID=3133428 RepID=UPI0030BACF2C
MAQIANTHATFNSSRVREQLMGKIWNVSVSETPTLALIGKTKADGPNEEWLTDSFAAGASNKVEQGNASALAAPADVSRYSNRTQISEKVGGVTGTQEAVEKAGDASEYDYQVSKKMVELKKDVEFGVLQNTTSIAAASGTAPQARGLLGFIATNTSYSGATNANPLTNVAPTDGTTRAFSENLMKDVLKLMFDNGAPMDNLYALIPSAQRGTFDGFLAGQTRFDKAEDKTLTATLEVYIGPFGRVKAVNARHMRSREVFVVNPGFVKLAVLRPMKDTKLAKTGDSENFLINTEWTLKVMNEKACGAVRDLS